MCLSGGADGADIAWGNIARQNNHQVIHWSFANHKTTCNADERCILTRTHLNDGLEVVLNANNSLMRKFPTASNYVNDLIFRNYYQVRDSSAIYAVTHITSKGTVVGGSAWAVQMFVDLHGERNVYVYCQTSEEWRSLLNGEFVKTTPPTPTGIWTGVGSRKLLPSGENAIRSIW